MDNFENDTMQNEEVEVNALEPVEPISMEEVKAQNQKKHDRLVFGGGILAGIGATFLYVKKVRPAIKKARAAQKAKKEAKRAAKAAAKEAMENSYDVES